MWLEFKVVGGSRALVNVEAVLVRDPPESISDEVLLRWCEERRRESCGQ